MHTLRAASPRLRNRSAALACLLCLAPLAGCGREAPSEGAVLIIESAPKSGAQIALGDTLYGTTPATIRGLPAGQYYAILNLYGFKRGSRTINLPESGELRVTIDMRPIVGYLSVETEPPGARVYLQNSDFLGTTPLLNVPIPTGNIGYELRLDKFVSLKSEIAVEEDYTYTRRHILEAQRGSLFVTSRPTGSKIFINDVLQQALTPSRFELAPGSYSVGAYHEGFLMGEEALVVEPDGNHAVDLALKEGYMPFGMVLIPAGEFLMGVDGGSPDERPRRTVSVGAFYIDKFEVTNKEFAAIFPTHQYNPRVDDHPATGISWDRATAYAQAVGKRLPTEQEWEKAARGIDGREYPWGNSFDPKLCNSGLKELDGEPTGTTRVGKFRAGASPYGVLDTAGNAYEWTSTWYQPYSGNADVKDEYGQVYRVLRGGSYLSDRFGVRVARRHYDKTDVAKEDYGFRCAVDATAPPPPGTKPQAAKP